MKVLQRYFATEIMQAVFFVLLAFLALFTFFDLASEVQSVGQGAYRLQHAFLYVFMGLPAYIYQLMPISALIGTIYALAKFAVRSEFTIMRVASLSTWQTALILAKIGAVFAILTFLLGEFVAPEAAKMAEQSKLRAQGSAAVSPQFRSGLWAKDMIKEHGLQGKVTGSRFLNVKETTPDGQLQEVKLYDFDRDFRLTTVTAATTGHYLGANTWRLSQVLETRFSIIDNTNNKNNVGKENTLSNQSKVETVKLANKDVVSEITPEILSILFADPDRMSAYDLATYTKHLADNKQDTVRYEIALWKKITYPLAIFVMMALALPFAYMHFRTGGVSLKIFAGVILGVSFALLNSLFSHLGLLNTWPAWSTALAPSALFLLLAITALYWVERH